MPQNVPLFFEKINSLIKFQLNLHINERILSVIAISTVTKMVPLTDSKCSIIFEFDVSQCTECLQENLSKGTGFSTDFKCNRSFIETP